MSINGLGRPRTEGFTLGHKFQFLTIVGRADTVRPDGYVREKYICQCVCGRTLIKGKTALHKEPGTRCKSCAGKVAAETRGDDGRSFTLTWSSWQSMQQRCNNQKHHAYQRYGGRGITVCRRWHDYDNFLADMGERPEGTSLERRKNNKGYSPGNCYWATRTEQQRNRRSNRYLTADGRTQLLADWAKELGTRPTTIWLRLEKLGWSEQDACTIAVAPRRKK